MQLDFHTVIEPHKLDLRQLEDSAVAGDPAAYFFTAYILQNGFNLYPIDGPLALHYARLGADLPQPDALCTATLNIMAHFYALTTTASDRQQIPSRMATIKPELERQANAGNLYAQAYGAIIDWLGLGVERNPTRAIATWQRLAEAGEPLSMFWLAERYETGTGIEKNETAALQLYQRAAATNMAEAQRVLSKIYFEGQLGSHQNLQKGWRYLRQARNQRLPDAITETAYFLNGGSNDATKDIELIVSICDEATRHGNVWGAVMRADLVKAGYAAGKSADVYMMYAQALNDWVNGIYAGEPTPVMQQNILGRMMELLKASRMTCDPKTNLTTYTWKDKSAIEITDRLYPKSRLIALDY